MSPATDSGSVGKVLQGATAALLFAAAIMQPRSPVPLVAAEDFTGDGSRTGTVSGFHGRGFHDHGGGFHHSSEHFRSGFGLGGVYAPYWWGYGYPYANCGYDGNYPAHRDYGYDPACSYYGTCPDYGYGSRPNTRQSWYYCTDPAGYYPYVAQCKGGWQAVPAS